MSKREADPTARSVYNPDYDFFVDTDRILMLENGSYHSLTFPIKRLGGNAAITENLVLSLEDDSSYSAAIYQYELTEENKTALLNGEPTNITGAISRKRLLDFDPNTVLGRIIQVWYTEVVVIPCSSGDHNGSNMSKWHECIVAKKAQILTITRSALIDVGDDPLPVQGAEMGSGGNHSTNGSYVPPPFDPGTDFNIIKGGLTKPLVNLKSAEEIFYYDVLDEEGRATMQIPDIRKPILEFLSENGWTENNKQNAKQILAHYADTGDLEFCEWALDFLAENPDTTPEQFDNWFLGTSEGKDWDYDSSYWNDPNLSFPQQDLPSWEDFDDAYPRNANGTYMTGADNIFNYVGGAVLQARIDNPAKTNNPCALKVSIALNGSGITIPHIVTTNGKPGTLQGADGKYYFLNAKSLNIWMKETFGTNPATATTPLNTKHFQYTEGGVNGEDFETAVKGKKGIFTMLPTDPDAFQASGHCDIYNGIKCAAGCYFDNASEVNIWVLD